MYAIIQTGGKQYRVAPGDVVSLERLNGEVGTTITFDKVLRKGWEFYEADEEPKSEDQK